MIDLLRHTKFLNRYTYFRAATKFQSDAQAGTRDLLNNDTIREIKAKIPKDK